MKIILSRIFWGICLILTGIMLLLESLDFIPGNEIFWIAFCAIVGLLFIILLFTNQMMWWAVIPGVILLTISATIGIETYTQVSGNISGAIMLGGIGSSFLLVFLINRIHWWALFPGGILITLAVVSALSESSFEYLGGGFFFLGLGLTFSVIALLPQVNGKMNWAWIPGIVMYLLAAITLAGTLSVFYIIFPTVLLISGGFFIYRAIKS